tara:strand:- start:401 stop:676 length:276 start_codon:yes stop_codon:yes gene_type:complete
MGTSIHKEKSSKESPMKFLGRRRGAAPAPEAFGPTDPVTGERGAPVEQGGGKGQLLKTLLNPAGAIANKMGAGDTALGKALNPLGGLFGRK